MNLTQKRLKELLDYDSETGIFTRLKTVGSARVGDIAGSPSSNGYLLISIDNNKYPASRLAWLYMEGYFPENDVDHENRIRLDNKWKNLRHVSRQCNLRNSGISKRNKSGIIGVCWDKGKEKWLARIFVSGKEFHLGRFNLIFDAARARWNAEIKHNFPNCNTTSTAYQYIRKELQT